MQNNIHLTFNQESANDYVNMRHLKKQEKQFTKGHLLGPEGIQTHILAPPRVCAHP